MSQVGYVYLIAADGRCEGLYKIGKSVSPEGRLKHLTLMPFNMKLAHIIKCQNPSVVESKLHNFFRSCRVNGEWFALSSEQAQMIMACGSDVEILEAIAGDKMTKKKAGRASFSLEPEYMNLLRQIAEVSGVNMSEVLRQMIDESAMELDLTPVKNLA
jgi:hypothetical protein